MITPKQLVDWVYERRSGTHLAEWTYAQVECYVMECAVAKQIMVSYDGANTINGVGIFNPKAWGGKFWINQIWATKAAMRTFIEAFKREYPGVTEIFANRGKNKQKFVCFKLSTLEKIYGR